MLSIDKINKLQQENEAYKQSEQEAQEIIAELQAENERLKEEINKIREGKCADCIQHLITKSHKLALEKANKVFKILQEIKEIAEKELYLKQNNSIKQILQKIAKL